MNTALEAAIVLAGVALSTVGIILVLVALVLGFIALFSFLFLEKHQPLALARSEKNPILKPVAEHWWESEAVFNPAAFVHDGRVHVLYRAMGHDGISRIGYASSLDGVHFDQRLPYPVYDQGANFDISHRSSAYRALSYNTMLYASGGGWGGVEDPRAVTIEESLYVNFVAFEGWGSIRMALVSLLLDDFSVGKWHWKKPLLISPPNQTHKNWVLFPEKIGGRFAILHALTPAVLVEYADSLEDLHENPIQSNNQRSGRPGAWDEFVRGAAAPPIKTESGWLLLYHAMKPSEGIGYKVGAMLLDLQDPSKILYRSSAPIFEPSEWYENDWKPGVVYASGAVVFGDDLLVYYGGGDKYIGMARANLHSFLHKLTHHQHAVLE